MIKIYDTNKVTLQTKDKYCTENIEIQVDDTGLDPKDIRKGTMILGVVGTATMGGVTPPTGTKVITTNGTHEVSRYKYAEVNVAGSGGITPEGTIELKTNGDHDVTNYATAKVNVPIPEGYIVPSGEKAITTNGKHDITSFASVDVNVPIPDGYIIPSGNFAITENGDYNIRDKETVSVNVAGSGGGDNLWADYMNARLNENSLIYLFCSNPLASVDEYLNGFDLSSVKYFQYMFQGCNKITSVPAFDTSSAINMMYMFDKCKSLTSVPLFNTPSLQYTYYMFEDCAKLQTVPLFDCSNVTDMNHMFSGCLELTEVPQFNTSKCTNMESMFYYCSKLTSAPLLDTSRVTKTTSMFQNCTSLTSVPLYDLSLVTGIGNMFSKCSSLKTIEMNSWEKVTSQYSANEILAYCYTLNKVVIRNATKAPLIYAGGYTSYGGLFRDCYCMGGIYNARYNPRGKSGRVYVPDALVDTFKTATNWSTYADIIYPESEMANEPTLQVADLTSMAVFNSTTTSPYIDKVDGEYQYEMHNGGSVYQFYFNVPEEATNRVMKIRFKHNNATSSYLFATTAIDDTSIKYHSDATADNTYFYHKGLDNGVGQEIIYENLPTGDHFICLPWQNSGTNISLSIDFVEEV